jgi:hypothetical protein
MRNLKIAAFTAAVLLGSSMMIGTAAATPKASEHFTGHIHQPGQWWQQGGGWHPWPLHWRHRWSGVKHAAKDRAD